MRYKQEQISCKYERISLVTGKLMENGILSNDESLR